jgi:hypothetical protein
MVAAGEIAVSGGGAETFLGLAEAAMLRPGVFTRGASGRRAAISMGSLGAALRFGRALRRRRSRPALCRCPSIDGNLGVPVRFRCTVLEIRRTEASCGVVGRLRSLERCG